MMEISLLPLLRVQRDLYDLPRGPERFKRYLEVMIGDSKDLVLPLPNFNPMGKDHVKEALDHLIALEAETLAVRAIEEGRQRLPGFTARFEVGLVLADDRGGGWTNRHTTDFEHRFRPKPMVKRGWAIVLAWTSEVSTVESIRRSVLAAIYRNAYILGHGEPKTLRRMMIQEGLAAVFSGETGLGLDPEELEYTRVVLEPYRDATEMAAIIPALFGDEAARRLGQTPLGLSDRAGLDLAIAEALADETSPEEALPSARSLA